MMMFSTASPSFSDVLMRINSHQIRAAMSRRGHVRLFVVALMSTVSAVAGDNSSVALTTELPRLQTTVFAVPEVSCRGTSCSGRCGTPSRPYKYAPCSCDKDCIIYQDCCLDFVSLCVDDGNDYTPGQIVPRPEGTALQSCVHHANYSFGPIFMAAECPDGYQKQGVKDLCEDKSSDFVLRHLPVVDGNSSFVYRNMYCAICNSLNISRIEAFTNDLLCPLNATASKQYLEARPIHEITFTEIVESRCEMRISQIRLDTYNSRECVRVDLDTCQETGAVKKACEAYLEPISIWSTKPETVARNKYCVQCSEFNELRTRCWVGRSSGVDVPRPGLKFSLLFDFTAIDVLANTPVSTNLLSSTPRSKDPPDTRVDGDFEHYVLELLASIDETEALDYLDSLSRNLVQEDFAWAKCLQLEPEESESKTSNNMTNYYHVNATFSSFKFNMNEILALSINLTARPIRGVRSISGSVKNIHNRLGEVCLSPLRYYDENAFRERAELFVNRNNFRDRRMVAQFPFEVLWSVGHNDIHFENCHGVSNWCTIAGGCSFPVVAVCGNMLEPDCEFTTFDNDTRGNTSVQNSLPELKESPLYQIGDTVATCKIISRETDILDDVEFYITVIGCSLSILGLTVTIGTYCSFQQLRTLAGNCVLNLVSALLIAQVFFVVGGFVAWRNKYACHAVGILQHFFWLATFCWTNVMSFDLARTFSGKTAFPYLHTGNKRLAQYMVVAWAWPVVVVGTTAALDFTSTVSVSYGQSGICWIRNRDVLLVAFVAPVTLHIIFNVIAFTFTVYNIRKIRNMADTLNALPERRGQLGVYSRITAVMGFTWVIGYLSNIWPLAALRIVFSGINSLQGFFIAVAFVFTSRVTKLYRNRYLRETPTSKRTYVYSTGARTANANNNN